MRGVKLNDPKAQQCVSTFRCVLTAHLRSLRYSGRLQSNLTWMAAAADEHRKFVSKRAQRRRNCYSIIIQERTCYLIAYLATSASPGLHIRRTYLTDLQGAPGALFEGYNAETVYV